MASPSASSVASFHTAHATPPSVNGVGMRSAGPGSDGEDAAAADATTNSGNLYRPVRPLPYELKGHVRVFLEERMYSEAIQLLTSLVAAGGSERRDDANHEAPNNTKKMASLSAQAGDGGSPAKQQGGGSSSRTASRPTPVWIPPPSHLAVLATLTVHPAYTSRTQENTDLRVAGHALQYLRHILAVAGPVQPDFRTAFVFGDVRGRGGGGGGGFGGGGSRAASLGSGGASAIASASVSVSASASASRSQSRLRRLRAPVGGGAGGRDGRDGRDGGGGGRGWRRGAGRSDYIDSRTLQFDDDDNDRTNAALAAAGISVDVLSPAPWGGGFTSSAGGDDGGAGGDPGFFGGGGGADADTDMDADEDAVSGRLATRDSVWARGQDFWRVAGWALSCSVEEPRRWRYWQPWLTLVVDVLEADLAARLRPGEEDVQQSLLFSYLQGWGGHTQLRHLVSAIMADGSQAVYLREIFDKETVTTTTTTTTDASTAAAAAAAPARLLDLDSTKFGDYSDDEESPPPSPLERKATLTEVSSGSGSGSGSRAGSNDSASTVIIPNTGNDPGFLESVPLRRRLFYLVVLAAICFPNDFAPVDVVYRTFADVLRETDVTVFSSFVTLPPPAVPASASTSTSSALLWTASARPPITADEAFIGLFRHILFTILPLSAPKPRVVDPDTDSRLGVSQPMLERCFLPFAANTVALGANVRMALVLESLFRVLWGAGRGSSSSSSSGSQDDEKQLCWTEALQEAADAGVRAREARPRPAKKKTFEVEAFGRDLMRRSSRRLLAMVQLAKMEV